MVRRLFPAVALFLAAMALPASPAAARASHHVAPTVWGWGSAGSGQLARSPAGLPACACWSSPGELKELTGVVQVVAARGFSLALTRDGSVYAWGQDTLGQLGVGKVRDNPCHCVDHPVRVTGLPRVEFLSAAYSHVLALTKSGALWAWGDDNEGQLGLGFVCRPYGSDCLYKIPCHCYNRPARVIRLPAVTSVSAGDGFSLALDRSGTVWGWGADFAGQIGVGTVEEEGCACTQIPTKMPIHHIRAISAGRDYALAITTGGQALAWGDNDRGQLGNGGSLDPDCLCVVDPAPVSGLGQVKQVSAGTGTFGLALDTSGHLWGWGYNHWANLGSGRASFVEHVPVRSARGHTFSWIAAGEAGAIALTPSGRLLTWGSGSRGTLGSGRVLRSTGTIGNMSCACRPTLKPVLGHVLSASIGAGQVLVLRG